MILLDTSIWIELLNGRQPKPSGDDLLHFVTCGPVVQEVLQGLRDNPAATEFRRNFLAVPCLADPLPRSLYLSAAGIYRQGRGRGATIRSSIDCLIAAIAIDHSIPVWHRDRDYTAIAKFTTLRSVTHWKPAPRAKPS